MSQRKEDKQTAFSVKPWKRLWRCVRQHRVRFVVAIISNLLMAAADFYIPLLQSEVVDAFITKGTTAGFGGYALRYGTVMALEGVHGAGDVQRARHEGRLLRQPAKAQP